MKPNSDGDNCKSNILISLQKIRGSLIELMERNKPPHFRNQARVTSVMDDYLKITDEILSVMSKTDDSTFRTVSSFIAEKKEHIDWCYNVSSYPEMLSIAKMHVQDDINNTLSFIEKLISKQKKA